MASQDEAQKAAERSFEEWHASAPLYDVMDLPAVRLAKRSRHEGWHARDAEVAALEELVTEAKELLRKIMAGGGMHYSTFGEAESWIDRADKLLECAPVGEESGDGMEGGEPPKTFAEWLKGHPNYGRRYLDFFTEAFGLDAFRAGRNSAAMPVAIPPRPTRAALRQEESASSGPMVSKRVVFEHIEKLEAIIRKLQG